MTIVCPAGIDVTHYLRRVQRRLGGDQQGFSLIELLVVILVAGVMMAAILGLLLGGIRVFASEGVRMQNQDDVRLGMNQITRYVRAATSSADHQATWSNAIVAAGPQSLEFYCDIDGTPPAEKVRYYLHGTDLRMQTATPYWRNSPPGWVYPAYSENGIVIQQAVRNEGAPVFSYLRHRNGALETFTPTTADDRRQIVAVDVTLRVNEAPQIAGDIVLSTRVQLRQRYEGGLK